MDHSLVTASPRPSVSVSQNGDRINDHHLTLAEKHAARETKEILS